MPGDVLTSEGGLTTPSGGRTDDEDRDEEAVLGADVVSRLLRYALDLAGDGTGTQGQEGSRPASRGRKAPRQGTADQGRDRGPLFPGWQIPACLGAGEYEGVTLECRGWETGA